MTLCEFFIGFHFDFRNSGDGRREFGYNRQKCWKSPGVINTLEVPPL